MTYIECLAKGKRKSHDSLSRYTKIEIDTERKTECVMLEWLVGLVGHRQAPLLALMCGCVVVVGIGESSPVPLR